MQEEIDRLMMEIQRSKFTERRTEVRQPFARPVKIHLPHGPTLKAFAKDLSSQGIGIITDIEFQLKSIAVLEIHSILSDPVCLRGEVRCVINTAKDGSLSAGNSSPAIRN